jgi:tRNA (guanine9-N1)-methyltransferase
MMDGVSAHLEEGREDGEAQEQKEEDDGDGEKKLSKNQLRKIRKTQKWEAAKLLKKEQKKLVKMNKRKREDEEVEEEERNSRCRNENGDHSENQERKLLKQQKKDKFLQECNANFKVVIDCSWEDDHTESTLKSLTQQISFCYGSNRRYNHPSRIFITGVGPKTSELLTKNNSQNWVGASVHSEDFLDVIANCVPLALSDPEQQPRPESEQQQQHSRENIVYLTSDSETVLEGLDLSTTYVIGGIVDRNRLKGITNKKAEDLHLRTAKLPIKEYMKMAATHVLTVNHVFDILKQFQEHQSWKIALEKVLPMRKGAKLAVSSETATETENEEKRETEEIEEEADSEAVVEEEKSTS